MGKTKTKTKTKTKAKTKAKAKAKAKTTTASTGVDVAGKTVVLTGTITGMERKDVEAKLLALGARVTGSVSKKTDYVFAAADAGSKKATAEALGVSVLGETELFALIGPPPPPKPPSAATKKRNRVTAEAKAKVKERAPEADEGFAGKTVVITGTLSRPRATIAALLEAAGADVTGSVSANTHYLVVGSDVGATKLTKAKGLGVTVIDEARLNELLDA
jgi:NAD-dependent DNA ligase